jgi:hypothetical protein
LRGVGEGTRAGGGAAGGDKYLVGSVAEIGIGEGESERAEGRREGGHLMKEWEWIGSTLVVYLYVITN